MTAAISEVGPDDLEPLAAWLGDEPETVQCLRRLRDGAGRAWVVGDPAAPSAALALLGPRYPYPAGFGTDPDLLWTLLARADGWEAIHVPFPLGPAMATVVERGTGAPPELIQELFYVLDGPVTPIPHPDVRLLGPADVPTMEAATGVLPGMAGWRLGSPAALVARSVVAGAVVDDDLLAVAFMGSWTDRHGEVGIATRPDAQGRGLASAAAALVIAEVQARGLVPVWSTSEDNLASRRVAAKLGFREVSRRVYVNRA